ncbi:L-rhamnose-binding lectin SML-like [Boleophthalmus pectinirostris]|uniref:L-rhamnose-binding lectin SML-like n=1 Tax=Boleophthalmus pectinirostris TaxID=150288 RepID=UPI00242ABE26|nr:L-rhamnose-binding lectin SML-like [Boleophthalmus pectinirostris]
MLCFMSVLWLAATCLDTATASYALSTTKVTTCDTLGYVHRLSCERGVIAVQAALYGRLDRETCSEGWTNNLKDITCSQSGTKAVLQNRCDGKTTCEVITNAFRFSDPCYGTYKYLESTYACVLEVSSSVVCEHYNTRLQCGQGQVIHVLSAYYGRTDHSTCCEGRPESQLQNIQCKLSVISNVAQMCNDKSSCSVGASNSVFGDPCVGPCKYLDVKYICQSPQPAVSVVCEHSTAHLRCGQGQVIHVLSAYYGRTDHSTCSEGRPESQLQNIQCKLSVISKVAQMCNGHSSCSVIASNSVFGDPCVGTYKYLDVKYICQNASV